MTLEEAARAAIASFPKCKHQSPLPHKDWPKDPERGMWCPRYAHPCSNIATVALGGKPIHYGRVYSTSPGWIVCDKHDKDSDPERRREDLPVAPLVRLLA